MRDGLEVVLGAAAGHPGRRRPSGGPWDAQPAQGPCGSDAWDDAHRDATSDAARRRALLLPLAFRPAAGGDAGTAVAHGPAGPSGGQPTASPYEPAALVRDKPGADRSGAQSYGVPQAPADRAVPDERRGFRLRRAHAAPPTGQDVAVELYRAVPPPDAPSVADATELTA